MTLLGSVDIPFTKSTKIAVDATDTAGQAATVAQQATDTAGQAQATAQTASQTATQAAATAADAAQAAQTAIATANGKNKAYYGATTPISPQPGDIWFVEDGSNNVTAIKHYDGTQWVTDVDNTALAQQISAAQAAADNAATVGQTAQQVAQQAAQVGDSAAKAAEAAQQAANAAQTDAANAVTQANNAVDTANTAKQVASDAATQSSNAWTKAQDAMAEAQKKADASSVYTKNDIDNALKGYATTTTVNTLMGRVDSAETAIQQNTNAIQLKADKSTVDTLTGRVSTAEATLTAQADQIAARITKTDADAKYATQTALTATANSITSNISAVQTNLDNLQVGGRNLAPFDKWQAWSGAPISKGSNTITLTSDGTTYYGIYHYEDSKYEPNTDYILTFKASLISGSISRMGGHSGMFDDSLSITKVYVDGNLVTGAVWTQGITISPSVGTTHAFEVHLRTKGDYSGETKGMFIQPNRGNFGSTYSMKFWDLKIEKGNKATDWTPAPEDMATQSQISQLVDDINLRVQKGDVINQINVSTEGILIDGKKVHITGQTTIDNAVIKDAMIQSMTANKLTAGTIDANVINVKNINASNIVTGTLDASKATVANIDASKITTGTLNAARIAAGSIDASKLNVSTLSALSANLGSVTAGNISGVNINIGNGNFSVDTAGNLVAKNANITGVINATSGSFSGVLEGATGTFKGQMTAGSINIGSNFSVDSNGNLTAKSGTFSGTLNGATFVGNTINIDNELNVRNGSISVTSDVQNPWGYYDSIKINPTYRFPIHVEDDDTNHTYISSGIIELYCPDDPDLNVSSSKLTIGADLISFSGGAALGTDAIYAVDYFNRESIIDSKGNAQFRNIKLNGYHSIISLDGGGLYFSDQNDSRIDINIATLYYTGSLKKSSSETIKANIEPINFSALGEIMKTDFYSYNYKTDLEKGITKPSYGVVIGDKYRLSDKFLTQDAQAVSIDNMTAINSQAIKELYKDMQKQNQQIVLKIADLELELANLKQKLGDA
ncbi:MULTISPECIES: gp58-like family protein [Heyndrickxia]|uniref:gp58-like family protein n=1 Tax=Heyndrickxia TaxID=2837504 RepID=UPI002DB55AA8|nr:gp58-like family protein [Weizmannia sp. CD-2023]MEC2222884.1 gp58-like family protein [Weizmannia sp. CD-2023]